MSVKLSVVYRHLFVFCPYEYPDFRTLGDLSSLSFNHSIRKRGIFLRKDDGKTIQRYYCKNCKRSFSRGTLSECFRQRKRSINFMLFNLLSSGVTQRRCARLLKINRKTVAQKLIFFYVQALKLRPGELQQLIAGGKKLITHIQMDELETFEHSKALPLSVPLAVIPEHRILLGLRVARMPAKGPLSLFSRIKYGPRADERKHRFQELLSELKPYLAPDVTISTDENPSYPGWIKEILPLAIHFSTKGARGRSDAQGELKKGGFDPLFSLNHTCAKLRADISRLIRKTWSTTKKRGCLRAHLELYLRYHNHHLQQATAL